MVAASLLAAFWAAFALALISPGPNFAVLLGTAMQKGRPAALKVAMGMAIGETVWGFGAVFGVAMLAARNPWIETVLRVGGGLFLLYLAVLSIRAALKKGDGGDALPKPETEAATAASARGSVMRGFGLMLLNPKAGVFWVSLTSVFLTPETPASIGWKLPLSPTLNQPATRSSLSSELRLRGPSSVTATRSSILIPNSPGK